MGNEAIADLVDTSDEWIVARSGIHQRHVAAGPFLDPVTPPGPGGVGTTGALATEAARQALERADLDASAIGMLVLCTCTPDQVMPPTAAAVAHALGISGGAMDVNVACAGFGYGLVTAGCLVAAGVDHLLLVGADTMTKATNFTDRGTAFLFGDGAGALVVSAASPGSLLGWDTGVDGALVPALYADHGDGMVMRGQEVFRNAVRATAASVHATLKQADVDGSDIALFVPHQANSRIMEAIAERTGVPADRIASVVADTANTGAGSIPLALSRAADDGRLRPGDLVLFAGFGAGMAWATSLWRWSAPR